MKTILIPIATGFEEIEAMSLIDVLRRADIKVLTVSLKDNLEVQGAHDIKVIADTSIQNITSEDIDMILLPGGWGGTKLLSQNEKVKNILQEMNNKNKDIAAICAAPYALNTAGVLSQNYTCYPSVEQDIRVEGYQSDKKIVEEGNILTSKGPGTAMCFALYIVKKYKGDVVYNSVKSGLLADFCEV